MDTANAPVHGPRLI